MIFKDYFDFFDIAEFQEVFFFISKSTSASPAGNPKNQFFVDFEVVIV